ncbi:MAG: helix-turn-helix domain-containing protein [Bacteroidia bacterium]|nr:helix-turn-helix domain-containing protein [Bacteroidia bacterium]
MELKAINISGIAIVAVFVLFILNKKNKQLSDWLLLILNIIFGVILSADIWVEEHNSSIIFILHSFLPHFIFPVYLSYSLLQLHAQKFKGYYWWFFLFPAIFFFYGIGDHFIWNSYQSYELKELYHEPPAIYHFFYKSINVFVILGLIWFLNKLVKYRKGLKQGFSYIEKLRLDWIFNFTLLYLFICLIALFGFLIANFQLFPIDIPAVFVGINMVLTLGIFYFTFHGIRHYVMTELPEVKAEDAPVEIREEKEKDQRYAEILKLFEEEKLYLEPKLSVADLSARMKIPPHQLSALINDESGNAFYDFVNEYRVEHLKKMLHMPEKKHLTILALGLESGFNSKASLNRVFKQHTGKTPSQFQKNLPSKEVSS